MMDEPSFNELRDRRAVSDRVIEYARSLDEKNWEKCRACFVDDIETDYSDLRGEPPSRETADEFVAKRRTALGVLRTLHLSANHVVTVDGDHARCVSDAVIYRFRPADNERFDTYCTYTHDLIRTKAGWKIVKVKQVVHWNTGNPDIHPGARR